MGRLRMAGLALALVVATIPFASAAPVARVVLTSADQSHLLESMPPVALEATVSGSGEIIKIDETIRYQELVGFGAALPDGAATLLSMALSKEKLHDLWVKLFDPVNGIGLSILRLPIGASDLSPALYSYEDTPGHFSIAHDIDAAPVIPLVRAAMALNPNLRVLGSPWSPPAWMKSNHSMIQGELAPEHQQDFADYLVRTVQAWQDAGLHVQAITMQNEPKNDNQFTTSVFNLLPDDTAKPFAKVDEQTFLKNFLGPALAHAGLSTKVLLWDHNYRQKSVDMVAEVLQLLQDPAARKLSAGVAFHCYSDGSPLEIANIPTAFPEQELYMSECSSGTWSSWNEEFVFDAEKWIVEPLRAGAKAVLKWGLALDDRHEPYLKPYSGSCNQCIGAVTVHNAKGGGYTGAYTLERDYYILGQISRFVRPGAVRVESSEAREGLRNVAFVNPDHSLAIYVFNPSATARQFSVASARGNFSYSLPALSAATFVIP